MTAATLLLNAWFMLLSPWQTFIPGPGVKGYAASARTLFGGCKSGTAFSSPATCSVASVTSSMRVVLYIVTDNTGSNFTSPSDDCGGSYSTVDGPSTTSTGRGQTFKGTGGAGTCTFSVSFSAGYAYLIAYVASGGDVDGAAHAINAQDGPGTGTDAVTSGSVSTANADLCIGFTGDTNVDSPTMTVGTGWTLRETQGAAGWSATSEDKTQSASGSIAATFTSSVGYAQFPTAIVCLH